MEKIARIDMGAAGGPKVTEEPVGAYAGLGGRAMTSIVVATEVHPLAHPLGAENKLVISPGMLSGTTGSMTGRLSVGCKSPLTGTIKESNAGGQAAQVLARIGYAAIILEGKPAGDDLYKIVVNKDGIRVIVDNSLKLLDNYPLVEKLRQEYGDKVAYMSIGSAGERGGHRADHEKAGEIAGSLVIGLKLPSARGHVKMVAAPCRGIIRIGIVVIFSTVCPSEPS